MTTTLRALFNDEAGFIVSAELILVATVGVIALVVGLAEVSYNVSEELEDVGTAVGKVSQSYEVSGTSGHKARFFGSSYRDQADFCDNEYDINCDGNYGGNNNGNYGH